MNTSRLRFSILSITVFAIATCIPAFGQAPGQNSENLAFKPSFDIQLFVLIASAEGTGRIDIPKVLDGTVRQLNDVLPFRNFRVGMTLLSRFKDRGSIEVSGAAAPRMFSQFNLGRPAFYGFSIAGTSVNLSSDSRALIVFESLHFSLNMPFPNPTVGTQVEEPSPVVNSYRTMSFKNTMSVQEGTPAIVGTFNTGQPDEQIVLVALVRRSND